MTRIAGLVLGIVVVLGVGCLDALAASRVAVNDTVVAAAEARVVLTDEFFGGRARALRIDLVSDRPDRQATLLLFLEKDDTIWQVNLTVVVPGQAVVRTVAGNPEELQRFTSGYAFDGRRLRLRSRGAYSEPNPPLTVRWDVDIDAAVTDIRRAR